MQKKILILDMRSLNAGSSTIEEFSNDNFCSKDPIPYCEFIPLLSSCLLQILHKKHIIHFYIIFRLLNNLNLFYLKKKLKSIVKTMILAYKTNKKKAKKKTKS